MKERYISVEAVADAVLGVKIAEDWMVDLIEVCSAISEVPAAEVVDKKDYEELLRAAKKMHAWIFLNSFDEVEAFKECGLSEEMNTMLGYLGSAVLSDKKEAEDA